MPVIPRIPRGCFKEGQPALFFLTIGYLLALRAAGTDALIVWWLGAVLLLPGWLLLNRAGRSRRLTPLAIIAALFASLLALHLFILPVPLSSTDFYIGVFMIISLVLGFGISAQAGGLFKYLLLIFALLALWALVQYFGQTAYIIQMGRRANAIFTTPNSFAAALNLITLLLIGLYLGGRLPRTAAALVLLLFAALLTSESRGGWIAFAGGMVLLLVLFRFTVSHFDKARFVRLLAGMGLVLVVYTVYHVSGFDIVRDDGLDSGGLQTAAERFPLATMAGSGSHRLQIYADTWQLIREKPWLGYGFMAFGDHYGRVQSDRHEHTIHFTHNDYLQLWMELGLPGLLLLTALIAACLWQAWRALPRLQPGQRLLVISLLAALGSYFAHALVDFVIYVPALFLLATGYIGYLNHLTAPALKIPALEAGTILSDRMRWTLKLLAVLVLAWLLFEPALAQVAHHAGEQRRQTEPVMAKQLYRMARSLAPYEPEYYHHEARWLLDAAQQNDFPERLQKAVDLYAASVDHNPYDIRGRYELARLNVLYGGLLKQPLDAEQINDLFSEVLRFRPWDDPLRSEINALRQIMRP